jgi:SAM-dependent methyltransferase
VSGSFDPRSPNIARVYSTLTGGKDNFECDRGAASKIAGISPDVPLIAAENKQFAVRATRWLAQQGITQFLDLGCGMPVDPNTHETAREVNPDARVAYADRDLIAISHMSAFARPGSGIAVALADVCDLGAVRAELADAVDFGRPVGVLMCALLHFYPPAEARELVREYAAVLAPGSYLAVSVVGCEGKVASRFARVYSAAIAPIYTYSAADAASLLSSLELVPPGVAPHTVWRPGWAEKPTGAPRDLWGHVAIARVARRPRPTCWF